MANTQGTADLISALTGGGGLEEAAYSKAAQRIMDAKATQAMMDKRIEDANLVRDQMRARGNYERNPEEVKFAVLAGLGKDFNQGMQGVGHQQSNQGQAEALAIARQIQKDGGSPEDVLNALIAASKGTLLGPGNVRVGEQAGARIDEDVAQALQAGAGARENNAQAANYEALNKWIDPKELATIQETQAGIGTKNAQTQYYQAQAEAERAKPPPIETLPSALSTLLYQEPTSIPVTTDSNFFGPDVVETLPLTDPRASAKWAGMTDDEKSAYMVDNAPDFLMWRATNIQTDSSLADIDVAVGKYMLKQKAGGGVAARGPAAVGTQGPGKNTGSLYGTMTNEQLAAELAARKAQLQ